MNRLRGYLHAICVISFAVCVMLGSAQQWNNPAFNRNEARRFLRLHNEARKNACVQNLTWDTELAASAQGLMNECAWSRGLHPRALRYRSESNGPNYRSPEQAMRNIVRQKRFTVDGRTDQCCSNSNTACCRYARVVNPLFKSLGCGQNTCNFTYASVPFLNEYTVVCFYGY